MPEAEWSKIKDLFHQALNLESESRDRFLDDACDGDLALRVEVESLLISFHEAQEFLVRPIVPDPQTLPQNWRLANGDRISHYIVIEPIAVGGMGEVYLATDSKLRREVALKVVRDELFADKERVRRFEREARAVSALNHPNILTIFDFDVIDGLHLMAAEHVRGITLRDRMTKGVIPDEEILDITIQIAAALEAAHTTGVTHRDIKPENIMIRDDGYVKVLDFGLAKLTESLRADDSPTATSTFLSNPGVIMGTTHYMSPEQARGLGVDHRTDIFSLGIVVYEMITGVTPFRAASAADIIAAIIQREPEPPGRTRVDTWADLDRVVLKMLKKNRTERYQSAADLLVDLKGLVLPESKPIVDIEKETALLPAVHELHHRGTLTWIPALAIAIALLALAALGLAYLTGRLSFTDSGERPVRSLAVLPLRSLDSGENYLGLGIADAVIRRISQTGELNVRPTSAVRRYLTEEIDAVTAAKTLSADAVLEGSVQRAGDRLRVSVNLLRAGDGTSLWAENFDMQMTDVFVIQDRVAEQVATRLRLQLNPQQTAKLAKRHTSNLAAYNLYVKGVYTFDKRGFGVAGKSNIDTAIDLFEQAVSRDPSYALAHAMLAHAYVWKALFVSSDEQDKWAALGEEEIRLAESLDPELAEIHIARAWLLFGGYQGYQTESAIQEILKAQKLDPSIGHLELAQFAYHVGLENLAEREFRRALDIDPTSEHAMSQYSIFYSLVNRWDDYLIVKQNYFPDRPISPFYYFSKRRLTEAKQVIAETAARDPADPYLPIDRAMMFALEGKAGASEQQVQLLLKNIDRRRPDYHHTTYDIACVYAVLGNTAKAMEWLRETAAKGNVNYGMFVRDPFLDRVRQSPEFIEFIAEMRTQYERYANEFGTR